MGDGGRHTRTSHQQRAPSTGSKDGRSGEGECPTPDTAPRGTRRLQLGSSGPPPKRGTPARRSVRCGVGDGFSRRHPLCPQTTVSAPRPPAPRTGSSGRRVPYPGRPSGGTTRPPTPPGAFMPLPQHAKPARKSVRCGVGDGYPRQKPQRPRQTGGGLRLPAPRTGSWGIDSAQPQMPLMGARGAPPGRPCTAPPARKASSQERAPLGW